MVRTPIAYIAFNRPEHTKQSFLILREQQPSKLFLIVDGPRSNQLADFDRCDQVRSILNNIDWPCEVYRNYADTNLGLKQRVSTGLNWVFEHVDRAIILEDDCLAHPDFFKFCDDLLDLYADDERVSVVTGNNFQNGRLRGNSSYYFSKYSHCWGWATWRRAWEKYQGDLPFWPSWGDSSEWRSINPDPIERHFWTSIFNEVKAGQIDSWAYPWTACVWHGGGLTATPNVNLVSNIGFGPDSTHTSSSNSPLSRLEVESIGEIHHPSKITADSDADRFVFDYTYEGIKMRFPYFILRIPVRITRYIYLFFKGILN